MRNVRSVSPCWKTERTSGNLSSGMGKLLATVSGSLMTADGGDFHRHTVVLDCRTTPGKSGRACAPLAGGVNVI